jgi:hypothetical protein
MSSEVYSAASSSSYLIEDEESDHYNDPLSVEQEEIFVQLDNTDAPVAPIVDHEPSITLGDFPYGEKRTRFDVESPFESYTAFTRRSKKARISLENAASQPSPLEVE